MKHRSMLSSVSWLSAGSVTSRVVGAVAGIVTARALGVSGRGELALLLVLGMLAGGVLPLGLDMWAARMLGRGSDLRAVRSRLVVHSALVGGVLLFATASAAALWRSATSLVLCTGLLCFTSTLATLKLGVLLGLNETRRYSAAILTSTAAYVALLLALAVAGRASVVTFVAAASLGQLVLVAWPSPDRRVHQDARSIDTYGRALRFGIPTAAGAVSAMLLYRADLFLVSWWAGVDAAGLYSVALAFTEVVWVVPTAAATALVPRAARGGSELDTPRLCRSVVLLMVVAGVTLSVSAPLLVPLVFGDSFSGAVVAVAPLALASVGVGVWKLVGHDLIARGDAHSRLGSGVCGTVVLVVLGALLIPRLGILGAAISSIVAYAVAAAWVIWRWSRMSGVKVSELLVPRVSDISYVVRRARGRPVGSGQPS